MTEPQRTAPPPPPRDMFGGRPIGGLGMPVQKAKNFKGTLVRLLRYLRPHRARLAIVVLAGAIGTVFAVLGPKILGDRKSTRLNSSHSTLSRMPSSA